MALQFKDIDQVAIAARYDFAPQWLTKAESSEDAQKLLSELCRNYDLLQAVVLVGDQAHDKTCWRVMLSSLANIGLTDILPIEKLLEILNKKLKHDNYITVEISANSKVAVRHLCFTVVNSHLLNTMVFVFESKNKFSFASLAVLRLISEILCKNFTENNIFVEGKKPLEKWLTEIELELLRLKSAGQSDDQLALTLNLSPHTVHYLLEHVMKKLGCSNSHSAVAKISRLNR